MSEEIVLVKVNGGFKYATDADKEIADCWKLGQAIKFKGTKQGERSLQYHRRYWGGLLALTLEYWEPDKGMTTEAEHRLLNSFGKWLDSMSGRTGICSEYANEFLAQLSQRRASKIEIPGKRIEDLHEFVKEKSGYYYTVMTPSGPTRKTYSINFNSMSQEQFQAYYKKAFGVCWRYVLAHQFKSEADAQKAAMQLLNLE